MLKKPAKILARIILTALIFIWMILVSTDQGFGPQVYIRLGIISVPVAGLAFLLIYLGRER